MENYKILGLEEKEYLTYCFLLDSPYSSQANVSRELHVSRTAAKAICDSLEKKGWIQKTKQNERFVYEAIDPRSNFIKIENSKKDLFFKLETAYLSSQNAPKVKIIESREEWKKVSEDLENNATDIYQVLPMDYVLSLKNSINEYYENVDFNKLKHVRFFVLYSSKDNYKPITKNKNQKTVEIKDINNEMNAIIDVWNNKVYINSPTGKIKHLYIEDEGIANTIRLLIKTIVNKK